MLTGVFAAVPASAEAQGGAVVQAALSSSASTNKAAKKKYKKMVKKLRKKYDVYYCIKDLTGDGIAELIADYHNSKDGSGNRFKIYTFKKGKAKCIFNSGEYGMYSLEYYNNNYNALVMSCAGHGGSYDAYYYFNGKKFEWAAESSQSDYSDEVYYRTVDYPEEATEAEFDEIADLITDGNESEITLKLAKKIKPKKPGKVKGVKATILIDNDNSTVPFNVKWKKVKGASGYQMKFGNEDGGGKYWSGTKTFKGAANTTFNTMLLYGTDICASKYGCSFLKIRAYKKVNGKKVYGKWSKIVNCKTYEKTNGKTKEKLY